MLALISRYLNVWETYRSGKTLYFDEQVWEKVPGTLSGDPKKHIRWSSWDKAQ